MVTILTILLMVSSALFISIVASVALNELLDQQCIRMREKMRELHINF